MHAAAAEGPGEYRTGHDAVQADSRRGQGSAHRGETQSAGRIFGEVGRLSRLFTAAALLCVLAGCSGHKPVIYLDHAWSLYYAKNNCYLYLPRGDRDPALQGCLSDETHGLESFEKILLFHSVCNPIVQALRSRRWPIGQRRKAPSGGF